MSQQKGYPTRAERREAARELAKLLVKEGPSKKKFRWDVTLTCAVAVMAIVIVFVPPVDRISTLAWLLLMFGLGVYPALHLGEWALPRCPKWIADLLAIAMVLLLISGFGWLRWPHVRRHKLTSDEWANFEKPLRSQDGPREKIEILCPQNDEVTCAYADQFINVFRDAGWTVVKNSLNRVLIARPLSGITLFKKSTGTPDPNNWRSGVWTRVSPSLVNVCQAFENIGIEPESGSNSELDDDVIAIYFGPEKVNEGERTQFTGIMEQYRAGKLPLPR